MLGIAAHAASETIAAMQPLRAIAALQLLIYAGIFAFLLHFSVCDFSSFSKNHSKTNGPPAASSSRITGVKPGLDYHRSAKPKKLKNYRFEMISVSKDLYCLCTVVRNPWAQGCPPTYNGKKQNTHTYLIFSIIQWRRHVHMI